ncbi:uncharacterized protein LOC135481007 [Liolophura sinensis]|uniref:uncharacterized protein LOC135481007 n=1 Tax=Liolophura sinensis TaxID=3198878 RepID=UPI0031586D4D
MRFKLLAVIAIWQTGFSLAQLYCPDCKTHEGLLECHPGPHSICNANEVCQIHAHEDPHGIAMETACRPAEHCHRDELHDPIRCALGLPGPGPGCVWCCDDVTCVDKYHYLLFPGQFTTQKPTTAASLTTHASMSTVAPVIESNCYLCEGATAVAECLAHPHDCELTQEVCMVFYNKGRITSFCRSDEFCRSVVHDNNTMDCYEGTLLNSDVCAFCCEAPGCMEKVVIPKLPSNMLDMTTPTSMPLTTLPALPVSTTPHPLGPGGEINCHVCEDAHHIDDCLRHPTYCHLDRNEICMVEYDPHGHVHSRCERDRRVCLDRELNNHLSCLFVTEHPEGPHQGPPGPPGPEGACVFCCETTDCFHQSLAPVIIGR